MASSVPMGVPAAASSATRRPKSLGASAPNASGATLAANVSMIRWSRRDRRLYAPKRSSPRVMALFVLEMLPAAVIALGAICIGFGFERGRDDEDDPDTHTTPANG